MASADFSQFVVTTAHVTACETSPVKVRSLSLHAPAAFTRTSDNLLDFSVFCHLIRISGPYMRFLFVRSEICLQLLQIPPHDRYPCCSAMCFVVVYAHSGLSPVRERPCWANKVQALCGLQGVFYDFNCQTPERKRLLYMAGY